jgi:hypothetical protein
LPGKDLEVELEYTPLPVSMDDTHRVGVQFLEESAPWVWLEIRAHIREPIMIVPPELTVRPSGRADEARCFEIRNCTDRDIRLLSVQTSAPWLEARPEAVCPSGESAPARQVWRVTVRVKADGLPARRHEAQVVIETDCADAPLQRVPVGLDLGAAVRATPGRLAFGTITPGTPARRRVLLQYPAGGSSGPGSVAVTHTLGNQLSVSYTRVSATQGMLCAVLTPTEKTGGGEVEGLIRVQFGGGDLSPVQIPVSAKVLRP